MLHIGLHGRFLGIRHEPSILFYSLCGNSQHRRTTVIGTRGGALIDGIRTMYLDFPLLFLTDNRLEISKGFTEPEYRRFFRNPVVNLRTVHPAC